MSQEVLEIINSLELILMLNGSFSRIKEEFEKLNTKLEKVNFSYELLKKHDLLPCIQDVVKETKNDEIASRNRLLGNQYYRENEFVKALESYNKCLCYAREESETAAYAYANRSIVYLKAGFYKYCLENIELALSHGYPKEFQNKLIARKNECLKKIESDKMENLCSDKKTFKLSYPANKKLPFMVNGLECVITPEFGRHLRAKQNFYPGDVLIIEKPFLNYVSKELRNNFCVNCLNTNFLNLRPCKQCTQVMFCSESCESNAWKCFHQFECAIIKGISEIFPNKATLAIRASLKAVTLFDDLKKLQDFINSIDLQKENLLNNEFDQLTEEIQFRGTYALTTHECDAFQRSGICAVAYYLLSYFTKLPNFLKDKNGENIFLNVLLHFISLSHINTFGLSYQNISSNLPTCSQFGGGLFPICGLLNHSCVPNLIIENIDGASVVVVRRPIRKGEQLFMNYG